MLILSRKQGQAIRFDGPAEVELGECSRGRARFVIRAPHSTRVVRRELIMDGGQDSAPGEDTPPRHDGGRDGQLAS